MQQFTVRATLVYLLCLAGGVCTPMTAQIALQPRTMPSVGTVSDRYVSYNVEAVEVTGGRFWKPYAAQAGTAPGDLYKYRKPIDLSNPKLRRLAAGLAPAFMRVSGTWRNSTYFQNDDRPAMETPPAGFRSVMTRPQWKGVVDFAQASGAALITSVAISDGTRDGNGVWTPQQATDFFNYTRSVGGSIFATEFMNEPSFAAAGAAPKGYDATGYARDFKVFSKAVREASPNTLLLGPGGIGEGVTLLASMKPPKEISSEDLLKANGASLRRVFVPLLHHALFTLRRQSDALIRERAYTCLSRSEPAGRGILRAVAGPVSSRQTDLADGNWGSRMRRQSLGV